MKMRDDNPQRSFYVLEQLHVLPNITYLEKIRNTTEIIESKDKKAEVMTGTENKKDSTSTVPSATKPE
jgi:molybdopterin-containing oxidoreductase family iron-sulfur binding subunit